MVQGKYFCTACGICEYHHDGPICLSEPEYPCAWDPAGFDLRTVIRSAGVSEHIPRYVRWSGCPYCRYDRPLMLNMRKPAMTFTTGMWERTKSSLLP